MIKKTKLSNCLFQILVTTLFICFLCIPAVKKLQNELKEGKQDYLTKVAFCEEINQGKYDNLEKLLKPNSSLKKIKFNNNGEPLNTGQQFVELSEIYKDCTTVYKKPSKISNNASNNVPTIFSYLFLITWCSPIIGFIFYIGYLVLKSKPLIIKNIVAVFYFNVRLMLIIGFLTYAGCSIIYVFEAWWQLLVAPFVIFVSILLIQTATLPMDDAELTSDWTAFLVAVMPFATLVLSFFSSYGSQLILSTILPTEIAKSIANYFFFIALFSAALHFCYYLFTDSKINYNGNSFFQYLSLIIK